MLLFQIFIAILTTIFTSVLGLVLFVFNIAFNILLFPLSILDRRAASDLSDFVSKKSMALLGFIAHGKNHMR